MRRSEYLKTRAGQEYEHRKRCLQKVNLTVNQEPRSKNSLHRNDKKIFRGQVKNVLKGQNRRAFRGDIVLQFDFYTTRNNPPALHTLTKNYLDLLHKSMPGVDNLQSILFKDDSQVKVLVANRHLKKISNTEPSITIHAYRFSHFLEDVRLAELIRNNDFADDKDFPLSKTTSFQFEEENSDISLVDSLNELRRFENEKPTYAKVIGKSGYHALRAVHLQKAQEDYLQFHKISISDLFLLFQSSFSTNKKYSNDIKFQELWETASNLISFRTNQFELGGAPAKSGDTNKLKQKIEKKLITFRKKYSILFPLLQPISITVFYTPPVSNVLDLDNLASLIIPILTEEFAPPEDFFSTYFEENPEYPKRSESCSQQRYGKLGISSYQIIYRPRRPNTPNSGSIDFCITDGLFKDNSMLRTIANYISEWQSQLPL